MILRTGVIALLFSLCLSGCSTTKQLIWTDQKVSFSHFETLEILPVFNATGSPLNKDILSLLNAHLKEQFMVHNLQITDAPKTREGVLSVKSNILILKF